MQMLDKKTLRAEATFSGAKRWMNCPASVSLCHGIKEEDDQTWRDEGTDSHTVASEALIHKTPLEEIKDGAAKIYVDYVRTVAGDADLIVEKRLSALGTSGGIDCYCLHGRVAHLFDYKHGRGIKRTAEDDEQLAGYVVLIKEHHPEVTTVVAHIIQPNLSGIFEDVPSITSWTLPWQTIRKWRNDFSEALDRVEDAQEVRAGTWCRTGFCKAVAFCPAYIAMSERAKNDTEVLVLPSNEEPDFEELALVPASSQVPAEQVKRIARLFSLRKAVEHWFEKAHVFILNQLKEGRVSAEDIGYELAKKRSNRIWTVGMSEEELAEELTKRGLPEDKLYKREFIRLTKAEELIDISGLTEKPEGGDTIRPIKVTPAKKKK
jgi:hypothetical protein